MSREERIQYLEEERILIWQKLVEIENLLSKKTSDYEQEAKLSSEQAEVYKTISADAKIAILEKLDNINSYGDAIKTTYESIIANEAHTTVLASEVVEKSENIHRINNEIVNKATEIQSKLVEIEKIFENKPIIDDKLIKLEGIFTKADDYESRINVAYKTIQEKKKEIDETYYEIFGFSEKNEAGEEIPVEGLKDELEKSYTLIAQKITDIDKELNELIIETNNKYNNFLNSSQSSFIEDRKIWHDSFTEILMKIESLLPNALTAGLSYAYSDKKIAEENESSIHFRTFKYGIAGLVIVSLIPFIISTFSIINDVSLDVVLSRVPRLVLAILPLYIPILWVAYSSNRKMNLSKRLIEEYSHKEVLSKTFEGLSKQIGGLAENEISLDLRNRLLYNILEVSSENPGKLISDYNKSDHPLMDALDKSIKLTNAVTKLAKIPGFSKLAASMEKKSRKMIEEQQKKVEDGIAAIEKDE